MSEQNENPEQSHVNLSGDQAYRIKYDQEYLFRRRLRARNFQILIAFLFVSFGVLIYFVKPFRGADWRISTFDVINGMVGFTLILSGVGTFLFIYLQSGSYKQIEKSVIATVNESRESPNVSERPKSETPAETHVNEDPLENSSTERISKESPLDPTLERKIAIIQSDYRKIINRLVDEIERLGKTANYNLVFGSVATVAGIAILTLNAFDQPPKNDTPDILIHYIPRLSTIVFIEIFAFFFLKIYKGNLADIKYFHNERTNIEQKILSLKSAIVTGDSKIVKGVIEELSKTERNRILKKGETTFELEREKAEITADNNVMEVLKSILDLKNVKSKKKAA